MYYIYIYTVVYGCVYFVLLRETSCPNQRNPRPLAYVILSLSTLAPTRRTPARATAGGPSARADRTDSSACVRHDP